MMPCNYKPYQRHSKMEFHRNGQTHAACVCVTVSVCKGNNFPSFVCAHTVPVDVSSFRCFSFRFHLFHCISFRHFCYNSVIIVICEIRRFVGPFSDLIHSWEKTLSLIYEIIDQWVNFTQRKWLYLEGIFVNNDARIKLPTIAAKFDLIDGEYIKVCATLGPKQ